METHVIPVSNLLLFSSLILLPILFLKLRKLTLWSELAVSVIRMVVQLLFIGFYLQFLFEKNSALLNILWVSIMILIANATIIKRAGLRRRVLFLSSWAGTLLATSFVGTALLFTVGATPLYDAPYLIPLIGMILGNSLQGNVIALERFYSSLRENRKLYELQLFNGASHYEALTPFINRALLAALSPAVGGMMTMGLVSLPGMMTGQILGGTIPMEAIKYQIAIMIAIFLSVFISILLNLFITPRVTFTRGGVLRSDIFRK